MFEPCKISVELLSNSLTQAAVILPKQVCGYFSISLKRPSIEGSFLVWFTKIMLLVRTYSTQKMQSEYLTSLNENKIMNHSIKLNGMVE